MMNGRKTPPNDRTVSGKSRPNSTTSNGSRNSSRPGSTKSGYISRPPTATKPKVKFSSNDVDTTPGNSRPNTGNSRGSDSRPTTSGTFRSSRRQSSAGPQSWAVTSINGLSTQGQYEKVKQILAKPSEQRMMHELTMLESWFRKKTKLFEKLKRDTLHDVIKHCEFKTKDQNAVIIEQGYKGNDFYIILRGKVAVMVKDEVLDEDEQLEANEENINEFLDHNIMETDRNKLGIVVNHLTDGGTFGELAIINDDNHRTASIVADDVTDLICISRELYERSVGKLIKEDFQLKLNFIEKNKLFREWPVKWKRQLATCIQRKILSYDEILIKQGEQSDHIYFIIRGELKLVADPDLHNEQFADFMRRISSDFEEDIYIKSCGTHFGLEHYYSPRSRQAKRLKSANADYKLDGVVHSIDLRENKMILSPSARRKMTVEARAKMHKKYNVCYLSAGQYVGDVEFLTGLNQYHATAISTAHDTVVIELHYMQFNRYFRKKNQDTVDEMTKQLGLQMPRRLVQEHISKNVPLLKCIMAKLDDLNGTNYIKRRPKQDDDCISVGDGESTVGHRSHGKLFTSSRPKGKPDMRGVQKYAGFGFSLPELPEQALAKYLSTQVNQVLQSETKEQEVDDEEEEIITTEGTPMDNPTGIHTMAKIERPKKVEKKQRESHPRDGIFFKVLQVSNPNIDKENLAIDEEEFNYLCQIKRRITKELHKYYPFASLDSFLSLGDNEARSGGGRICKRMTQSAGPKADNTRPKRKGLSKLAPTKTSLRTTKSAGVDRRKSVGFSV